MVYRKRLVDSLLRQAFSAVPAIALTGPRAAGKTTTAMRHAGSVVHLDNDTEAAAFRADPDAALRRCSEPVLLDEWQAVPAILGAVKRAVDDDPRPTRFLLTGSARSDLDHGVWPVTGRVIRIPVWPLTQREILGTVGGPSLLARLLADGVEGLPDPGDAPDLPGYLDMAVRGGLPPAVLSTTSELRANWYRSYLEYLVTHDATQIAGNRDPVRLRRYLDVLAECSAGLPADTTLLSASGINARTLAAYDHLLEALGILDVVPAWTTNRIKRLMLRGKRYVTDTGVLAAALQADADDLLRNGELHGRVLDSFVASQLRPELSIQPRPPLLYHLRDKDGRHEVDQLVDAGRRGIVAIEVKSTAAPKASDAAHLCWLHERLGNSFQAGIVFHTGPRTFLLGDRIAAVPIACLWTSRPIEP